MVAAPTTARRFEPLTLASVASGLAPVRFTVDEALALVRMGLIPEDATTELLDGLIVHKDRAATGGDPLMIGEDHTMSVEQLALLRGAINSPARHARSQQPLVCSPTHAPEPDFMILRGALADYRTRPRPATAADALCVVEVADSSLERDLGEKLAAYARAGVPQYVVLNLRDRIALVHEGPDAAAGTYPPPAVLAEGATLLLRVGDAGETHAVALADVLP